MHSAKDVPTEIPDGLELVAIPERADARDAICGAPSLEALPAGARVGTSSLRRSAQLRALRPTCRSSRCAATSTPGCASSPRGEVDALVLALPGLSGSGASDEIGGELGELVPAAGQGALAIEARTRRRRSRARSEG